MENQIQSIQNQIKVLEQCKTDEIERHRNIYWITTVVRHKRRLEDIDTKLNFLYEQLTKLED